jgi:hypothetical protein
LFKSTRTRQQGLLVLSAVIGKLRVLKADFAGLKQLTWLATEWRKNSDFAVTEGEKRRATCLDCAKKSRAAQLPCSALSKTCSYFAIKYR